MGGAVSSGSFQAFYQSCSSISWSGSVPTSWASPIWLDAASALREVAAANPGALMFETELPRTEAACVTTTKRNPKGRRSSYGGRGHQ